MTHLKPARILIMGLPGSGKTYLATYLKQILESYQHSVQWFNADEIRKQFDDWDFSVEGRIRQSVRMRQLADASSADFIICDFVAPLPQMRDNYQAHWTIWVDTIQEGRFEDTNKAFIAPEDYDFRVTEKDAASWSCTIADKINRETKLK